MPCSKRRRPKTTAPHEQFKDVRVFTMTALHSPVADVKGSSNYSASAVEAVRHHALFVPPESGYRNPPDLYGVVIEFATEPSTRLLFVAVDTSELSNDHLGRYEALFAIEADESLRLLSITRRFFDVAGLESAEWPGVAVCTFPAWLVVLAILARRATAGRHGLR